MGIRKGRQTPTTAVVLPYQNSLGAEAVELYNQSDRKAQPWQELLIEDIMAVTPEGLWLHMKYGFSVPRRNGKSEILIIRACYGVSHDERVLYTAHRTTTSHNAWEKIVERLSKAGFVEGDDYKTTKQFGLERIEWLQGSGIINFRTRSSKGGLGEGYDLLVIDEAQEYTSDQESALKYVVTDSKNPQTVLCGTPPTAVSSGTVFLDLRNSVLSGVSEDCGWAEWSVPQLTDAHDPELWYETNPSLGTILTERKIRSELGKDQVDDNIQRLGLWLRYNQKSAISREEWMQYVSGKPTLCPGFHPCYGVKYTTKTGRAVLCAAIRTADGKIFVEGIDCRPARDGNAWMMPYFRTASAIVVDGASGQSVLAGEMRDAGIKCKPILPKVAEIIAANALFEKNLFSGQICHAAQPAMIQAVSNCDHRAIGSGGGFGYVSIMEDAESGLVEAVSLAHWACAGIKSEKKKPKICY